MFRPGSQKRTAAPNPGGEDHRRHRPNHVSDCVCRVSHLLLHPLQGVFLMVPLRPPLLAAGRFV